MNNHRQTDQTTKRLPCLVALLFSLAVIADWAAAAPAPVRYAVMLILRRAEAIAYSQIYWELHGHGLTLQWALPHGCRQYSDPGDALMFGWWFRILAVALRDLPRRVFFARRRCQNSASPHHSRGSEGRARPVARPGMGTGEGQFFSAALRAGKPDASGNLRQRGPPTPADVCFQAAWWTKLHRASGARYCLAH